MLSRSIRTSAVRRCYSSAAVTSTEAAGIKVVARDAESPVSRVSVVVKAGSRYAPVPGAAHLLKNFAFHTQTSTKSGLRRWRESELVGGTYSAQLGRENIVLSAEFLRTGLPHYVENVADVLANSLYKKHEFVERVLPQSIADSRKANLDTAFVALENAHAVAFRKGLGSPLYVQDYSPVSVEDVANFGREAYTKDNITIYATGVDTKDFTDLVAKHLPKLHSGAALKPTHAVKFHGGESRTPSASGNSIVIAFPTAPSAANALVAKVLGGESHVKWSAGQSPLSAASLKTGASIKASAENYSDASLLYVTITGPTAAIAKSGAVEAVKAIKGLSSVTEELVSRAIAQAKFDAAANADESFVAALSGEAKVAGDAASVKKTAGELVKGPIVLSVVGNVQELPYLDELF